ncbi:MAG TPA: hypothetical protein VGU44_06155 [Gammaproteobacteria bacterium]|nr:hypothetical protein [Gammaproteobacteria bacterium]
MAGRLTTHPKTKLALTVLGSLFWLAVSVVLILSVAGSPIAGYTLVLSGTAALNVLGLLSLTGFTLGVSAYLSPFWQSIKGFIPPPLRAFFQFCKQGVFTFWGPSNIRYLSIILIIY